MVALRATFRPDRAAGTRAQYELRIDGQVFSVEIGDGQVRVGQGGASRPLMTLATDLRTLVALVSGEVSHADALRTGRASVEGDSKQLQRFIELFAWRTRLDARHGGAAR
jgi:putative sterol carrier protein